MMLVASFTDAWIETEVKQAEKTMRKGRIFYRCVDWNSEDEEENADQEVASFTDAWIETKLCK